MKIVRPEAANRIFSFPFMSPYNVYTHFHRYCSLSSIIVISKLLFAICKVTKPFTSRANSLKMHYLNPEENPEFVFFCSASKILASIVEMSIRTPSPRYDIETNKQQSVKIRIQ